MRAFGADVELIPSPEGITPTLIPRMRARAAEIAAEIGAYQTDQFNNTDMVEGYLGLGRELFDQVDGRLDAVVRVRRDGRLLPRHDAGPARAAPVHPPRRGRAGRVGGAVRRRARHAPDRGRRRRVRAAAARPGGRASTRSSRCRRPMPWRWPVGRAREDGVWSGPSSGANIAAALQVARRLGEGARVATVQVDSGLKYLAGELYS